MVGLQPAGLCETASHGSKKVCFSAAVGVSRARHLPFRPLIQLDSGARGGTEATRHKTPKERQRVCATTHPWSSTVAGVTRQAPKQRQRVHATMPPGITVGVVPAQAPKERQSVRAIMQILGNQCRVQQKSGGTPSESVSSPHALGGPRGGAPLTRGPNPASCEGSGSTSPASSSAAQLFVAKRAGLI